MLESIITLVKKIGKISPITTKNNITLTVITKFKNINHDCVIGVLLVFFIHVIYHRDKSKTIILIRN